MIITALTIIVVVGIVVMLLFNRYERRRDDRWNSGIVWLHRLRKRATDTKDPDVLLEIRHDLVHQSHYYFGDTPGMLAIISNLIINIDKKLSECTGTD